MLFQDTFDLASEYFHCHMKYSRSSTHNICNIYYNNNNNKIDLTHELNILNKLHDDFELGNEGSSKLSAILLRSSNKTIMIAFLFLVY